MTSEVFLPLACSTALVACAHAKTPPPAIHYDPASFAPAKIEPEPPRPVRIVEIPCPASPGQLLPAPIVRAEAGTPRARIEAANRSATLEPSTAGYINAVQVYPWSEGRSIGSTPRPNGSATSPWSLVNSRRPSRRATPCAG